MTLVTVQCDTVEAVIWKRYTAGLPSDAPALYRVSIAEFAPVMPLLTGLLQPDELMRARRYHQPKDQQRFIVARGVLRVLLGQYTGQQPATIRFETGPNKKPVLCGFPALHYNVAHAGNWILMAVADSPIGVDVEYVNPETDYRAVLVNTFGPAEQAYVAESPDRRLSFYQLWTRKEALTKATAKGIDDDFSRIPALTGTHRVTGDLLSTALDWHVSSFIAADAYLAALAHSGGVGRQVSAFCHADPGLLDTDSGLVIR